MKDADVSRRALMAAAREFNRGRYFEAHEELEESLDDIPDESWDLFLGLIQIAVAYHKVSQGLLTDAAAMFEKALAKVEAFAADASGIRLEELRARARDDLAALRSRRFDRNQFAAQPPRFHLLPRTRER